MEFLGFKLSPNGIAPLKERVEAINKFPRPTSVRQLRRFLGLFNFYRRFVPKAAKILEPLHSFLKGLKNIKGNKNKEDLLAINGNEKAEKAFKDAKEELAKTTVLVHPNADAKMSLWVDASEVAVGGTLMQPINKTGEPVGFYSIQLKENQRKWSVYDRRCSV